MNIYNVFCHVVVMILNSLRNNRFGLGGGTPQLHHFSYGADIVSTGEVKANRLNPGCSVINKIKTEWR